MAKELEALSFDPYELLAVDENAQEKELVKAFRRKALEYHPDKNPDRKEFGTECNRERRLKQQCSF